MDQKLDDTVLIGLAEILSSQHCDIDEIYNRLNLKRSDDNNIVDNQIYMLLKKVKESERVQDLIEVLPNCILGLPYKVSILSDIEKIVYELPKKMEKVLTIEDFTEIYKSYGLPHVSVQWRTKERIVSALLTDALENYRILALLESIKKTRPNFYSVEDRNRYWNQYLPIEERPKILRQEKLSSFAIYRETFRLLSKNFLPLILLNLPLILLSLAYTWLFMPDTMMASTDYFFDHTRSTFGAIVFGITAFFLILYLFSLGLLATNIATMIGSSYWILGRHTTIWSIYRRVLNHYFIRSHFDLVKYGFFRLLGVMIVALVLGWISPILAFLFQSGFLIWMFFGFFLQRFLFGVVIAVEKSKFLRAYDRSQHLTFGYLPQMFVTIGIVSIFMELLTILAFDIGFWGDISINWWLLGVILLFSTPVLNLMTAVIYYELRKVKEGYNEEMLAVDLGYAPIVEHFNL